MRTTSVDRARSGDTAIWLALVAVIAPELDDPVWTGTGNSPVGQARPLIDGCTLRADGRRLTSLIARLRRVAEAADLLPPATIGVADVEAAIRSTGPIEPVAHLASLPLLAGFRRANADGPRREWTEGWCRVCGAWPVLAELRGLERERRLRCGRCGDDWSFPWLRCVFCCEGRHDRLGALVPEGGGESHRVENCHECRGALKSVATLTALSHAEVLRKDGETIELDWAAVDRGYRRPNGLGRSATVEIAPS